MKQQIIILLLCVSSTLYAQNLELGKLPLFNKDKITVRGDWLVDQIDAKAGLYRTDDAKLVFANGIVSRTFLLEPNCATVGLDHLINNESFLRSVRPEAEVEIDGNKISVGGLNGQTIHNYLSAGCINGLKAGPEAFKLVGYILEDTKARFPWKKRTEWMPKDIPWPPPGKELIFTYKLDQNALGLMAANSVDDHARTVLFEDRFKKLGKKWKVYESGADNRNSFINEGKPGEIMALTNTAVYADREIVEGSIVFLLKVDPGTDLSSSWGPGLGLIWEDKTIKINLRPGNKQFGFFDGEHEKNVKGMLPGKSVWLRLEIKNNRVLAKYSYDKTSWVQINGVPINGYPKYVRVGKMDWQGKNSDHKNKGKRGRCHIEEFRVLGAVPENSKVESVEKLAYLKDISVDVHYVLYDGLPLFSKWITIGNKSGKEIKVNSFKSEILAAIEPRNEPQYKQAWMLPNITIQTDYDCGGGMQYELGEGKAYNWEIDPIYKTQINWPRKNPCLLVVKPEYGPAQIIEPGKIFESYHVWELIHSSREREHKGLEIRRMMRTIAPWITENPIMMHARFADTKSVKSVIDQCAEVGFEKVILTFGSGFNIEDDSEENIHRMKMLADYAHSKNVTLGGYSLLASRRLGGGNDVVVPKGMRPRFGNSPCLCSKWGEGYFKKLYNFYKKTGFDNLEHDGSYPGDICISSEHPGHTGLADSRWNQYMVVRDFYRWCKKEGIFLNIPDWYFLNGGNKVGMGYRETNWSLPRAQQEIIERQNIYDGTWFKTPSMGWMHVPLTQYHGGGKAATYEPLHEHLKSYEQRLANLFGAGVQAAWRGKELYDTGKTKAVVKKWVDFYKAHRRILDGDIIHLRRADGRDYDAILHVDPTGKEKGLLMVYNPLNETIKRKIKVNLYYTGIKNEAEITAQTGKTKMVKLNRGYNVWIDVEIPAHSQTWFVIK